MPTISMSTKQIIKLMGSKWSIEILLTISTLQVTGFNQLQQELSSISHKVLTDRFKELVTHCLVSRTIVERIPLRVIYKISPKGLSILTMLEQLND
ncbi:helix-turn-helix domain-containing protein [Leuconostoc gasicomitatum]|uniref:winged helix-turn-helix transcriptional regulator n=1 Tax=Leuconostoc gasicomitatum TaxID=115778 RepID=UPI000BD9E85B|nr:helix-turn-helix domain-containing protein [Leuconostoc gasicomitatum]MBZ5943899.1 helix-turn-helix transcriptional regulator [Leuconostoc gasicomitatum]MBZ5949281.1 helix-turn-helix transcriptional regulator [Leuconostoc gasicomitatum]MBZ5951232.1 helix-turn-helix transcriptional regulator [Leuconostoc gasicomitatum]MBZ5967294.1 helix-turn-helix transcriptional regulator [Leuconostoc gasicomitatum]MBZ5971336.1 helix-turn-helix transcriptional regulator [Leuconostoc gasicomitatum]